MLHVLNGDSTRASFKAAGIDGDVLVWRDMLSEGPAPAALAGEAAWELRAARLEADCGIPRSEYLAGARASREGLSAVERHDEVALWFEQDLFCLANALYVLARLREQKQPGLRVSLVHPEKPLGPMQGAQLRPLFEARREAAVELALASEAWPAFAGPDPRAVERLAQRAEGWPFLSRGLRLHLQRFPSKAHGLGAPEEAVLRALRAGSLGFTALFARLQPALAGYGFGDVQVAAMLRELARSPAIVEGATPHMEGRAFLDWELGLTALGRDVLEGRADAVRVRGVDRWLGGVHLREDTWRWDGAQGALVHT